MLILADGCELSIIILMFRWILNAQNCKKIPQPAKKYRNVQADGRRTAVETFLTRTKVGRKKPSANRIREFLIKQTLVKDCRRLRNL